MTGRDQILDGPVARPITPIDLDSDRFSLIGDAAQISGGHGDAVIALNFDEHERRQREGLGAVVDLALLDALMNLPHGGAIPVSDLADYERAIYERAPKGVVERDADQLVRLLDRPLTVHAVIIRGRGWRNLLGRVSAFGPVCQRIIWFEHEPHGLSDVSWEAEYAGVGVWFERGDKIVEALRPAVHQPLYQKPARWRFEERAYRMYLRSMSQPELSSENLGRRSRRGLVGSDPPQLALHWD